MATPLPEMTVGELVKAFGGDGGAIAFGLFFGRKLWKRIDEALKQLSRVDRRIDRLLKHEGIETTRIGAAEETPDGN